MERHANKGKRGVRVYFEMSGSTDIYSDVVKATRGDRVIFHGDNWCHKKDCYLTMAQCRRGTGQWTRDAIEKTKHTVETAAKALDEAKQRLDGLITSLEGEKYP